MSIFTCRKKAARALFVVCAGAAACSSPQESMPSPDGAPTTGDMAMMTASGALPFAVDNVYAPSGFMGDGMMVGIVTMVPAKVGDSKDCNGQRSSAGAVGICHQVTYAPHPTGGMGWAGVFWQYPANNWGTKPGFTIAPGATQVTFSAKGQKGGEKVTFLAGGIGSGMQYADSLKASADTVLTAQWATYSVNIGGMGYSQVLGGFGWTMTAASAGTFFIDDIHWQ
jgi:hypothetical protein